MLAHTFRHISRDNLGKLRVPVPTNESFVSVEYRASDLPRSVLVLFMMAPGGTENSVRGWRLFHEKKFQLKMGDCQLWLCTRYWCLLARWARIRAQGHTKKQAWKATQFRRWHPTIFEMTCKCTDTGSRYPVLPDADIGSSFAHNFTQKTQKTIAKIHKLWN